MLNPQEHYSESFKRQVVAEVESGKISPGAARKKYGIQGHSIILKWRRKYGTAQPERKRDTFSSTELNEVALLRSEVRLLKQELDYARMRSVAMETMIDLAEEKFRIPIRKKSGAKQ